MTRRFAPPSKPRRPSIGWPRPSPTRLLTKADSVLAGMAAIGAEPDRYLIAYDTRGWR